ncbi:MAG: hypothetical protein ACREJD_09555 [Phycisphaerales bacterium]
MGTTKETAPHSGLSTPVQWHDDDLWIFRRLGLEEPSELPTKEVLRFPEVDLPDTHRARVQLSMLGLSTGEKMVAVLATASNGVVYDLVVRTTNLRDIWPTVELVASGRVVTLQAGGVPKPHRAGVRIVKAVDLMAAAAADLPPVSLKQGSYAHDHEGNASPVDPHSPTQSEISAARAGGGE